MPRMAANSTEATGQTIQVISHRPKSGSRRGRPPPPAASRSRRFFRGGALPGRLPPGSPPAGAARRRLRAPSLWEGAEKAGSHDGEDQHDGKSLGDLAAGDGAQKQREQAEHKEQHRERDRADKDRFKGGVAFAQRAFCPAFQRKFFAAEVFTLGVAHGGGEQYRKAAYDGEQERGKADAARRFLRSPHSPNAAAAPNSSSTTGLSTKNKPARATFRPKAALSSKYAWASASESWRRGVVFLAGSSRSGAVHSSFKRKSVETPKTRLSPKMRSRSGMLCALSHLETDWRETPSCSASSSCDMPLRLRSSAIFSARVMGQFPPSAPKHSRSFGCRPQSALDSCATGGCVLNRSLLTKRVKVQKWPLCP